MSASVLPSASVALPGSGCPKCFRASHPLRGGSGKRGCAPPQTQSPRIPERAPTPARTGTNPTPRQAALRLVAWRAEILVSPIGDNGGRRDQPVPTGLGSPVADRESSINSARNDSRIDRGVLITLASPIRCPRKCATYEARP